MSDSDKLLTSFQKLSGLGFEDAQSKLNSASPPVLSNTSYIHNMNVKAYGKLCSNYHVSKSDIASEVSSLTGMGYENALMKLNKIDYSK